MKLRYGFISNSSSSSFVGITNPIAHKRALAQLNDDERYLMEQCGFTTQEMSLGIDFGRYHDDSADFILIVQETWDGEWSINELHSEGDAARAVADRLGVVDRYDLGDFVDEIFRKYINLLEKQSAIIYHEECR